MYGCFGFINLIKEVRNFEFLNFVFIFVNVSEKGC